MKMRNKEEVVEIEEPNHIQCQHEEADVLLWEHSGKAHRYRFPIILVGLSGRSEGINIIQDYGSGNYRRYIGVSKLAVILEEK